MELKTAITLIERAFPERKKQEKWADPGCGTGLFTKAIAHLIAPGSEIFAVDFDRTALTSIPDYIEGMTIKKLHANINNWLLQQNRYDGILMANTLHFFPNKNSLISNLLNALTNGGRLVIIEYDSPNANYWVPYPIDYEGLIDTIHEFPGYEIKKIGETPSKFRSGNIYSAMVFKNKKESKAIP